MKYFDEGLCVKVLLMDIVKTDVMFVICFG
jgi:hypothetical protein